jgi:hypothetical protein
MAECATRLGRYPVASGGIEAVMARKKLFPRKHVLELSRLLTRERLERTGIVEGTDASADPDLEHFFRILRSPAYKKKRSRHVTRQAVKRLAK